jgi:hypothetical protein
MAQKLQLPDGRNLDYFVGGAQDGFPLIWIHGTPGAYNPLLPFVRACEKKGVKLITFSRAGYGGSTRDKGGRSIVHAINDIRALKQHLGIERCFVGGWSGGGKSPVESCLSKNQRLICQTRSVYSSLRCSIARRGGCIERRRCGAVRRRRLGFSSWPRRR